MGKGEPKEDPAATWTRQDAAECGRLVQEMADDARWQFQFFTFALTAAAIVLGVLASTPVGQGQFPSAGTPQTSSGPDVGVRRDADHDTTRMVPKELTFISPLVILIPSSLIILNRARTRNRKAAYMISYLDYKRLRLAGVRDTHSLAAVRVRNDLPWETALHIVERTNTAAGGPRRGKPHLAPSLGFMGLSYLAVEGMCVAMLVLLAAGILGPEGWISLTASGVVVMVAATTLKFRWGALRRLQREESIQGYVRTWLHLRLGNYKDGPRYLVEWLDSFSEHLGPLPTEGVRSSWWKRMGERIGLRDVRLVVEGPRPPSS